VVIVKRIPLRNRAGETVAHALVDDADYEWAMQWRWSLIRHSGKKSYARRGTMRSNEPQRTYFLHRELMGLKHGDGLEVDHRNGDGLDNRRSNLRVCSRSQNAQNRSGSYPGARSPHRGVWFDKRRGKWIAEGKINYRKTHIGQFDSEQEAAAAARVWRRRRMPFSEGDRA
jgi:hypothetical protein